MLTAMLRISVLVWDAFNHSWVELPIENVSSTVRTTPPDIVSASDSEALVAAWATLGSMFLFLLLLALAALYRRRRPGRNGIVGFIPV